MSNQQIVIDRLDIITRLLHVQAKVSIQHLKGELLDTPKKQALHSALTGSNSIEQAAKVAGCSARLAEQLLPEWEKAGLILGTGKGRGKRYVNLDHVYL